MDVWKHSESSKKKFGGKESDYLEIHKFIDSSKLFFYNIKHRVLLHNLFGVDVAIKKFGDTIENSEGSIVLVRDIAVEHIKEDLNGEIPSLNDWLASNDVLIAPNMQIPEFEEKVLEEFVLWPMIMSNLKSSLLITFSDFGIFLAKEILGLEYAKKLMDKVPERNTIKHLLEKFEFTENWQLTSQIITKERPSINIFNYYDFLQKYLTELNEEDKRLFVKWDAGGDDCLIGFYGDREEGKSVKNDEILNKLRLEIINKFNLPNVGEFYKKGFGEIVIWGKRIKLIYDEFNYGDHTKEKVKLGYVKLKDTKYCKKLRETSNKPLFFAGKVGLHNERFKFYVPNSLNLWYNNELQQKPYNQFVVWKNLTSPVISDFKTPNFREKVLDEIKEGILKYIFTKIGYAYSAIRFIGQIKKTEVSISLFTDTKQNEIFLFELEIEENARINRVCDECRSEYYGETSKMMSLCPDCAHHLYGYNNCNHKFENNRCIHCNWNGRSSARIMNLKKSDS